MARESFGVVGFDLGPLLQGQTRIAKLKSASNSLIIGARGFKCETNHGLGIFSLNLFYYCFYRFAMFGDTPPTHNKESGIILVSILYHLHIFTWLANFLLFHEMPFCHV